MFQIFSDFRLTWPWPPQSLQGLSLPSESVLTSSGPRSGTARWLPSGPGGRREATTGRQPTSRPSLPQLWPTLWPGTAVRALYWWEVTRICPMLSLSRIVKFDRILNIFIFGKCAEYWISKKWINKKKIVVLRPQYSNGLNLNSNTANRSKLLDKK